MAADGAGHSLVPLANALASENLKSLTYGGHWAASAFIGGSPGKNNPAPPPSVVLNELMAHTYAHLFSIPCTGLRFFTVYGPWGRPDMAIFIFTRAILAGEPIDIYNHGHMRRDFTYIDDIIEPAETRPRLIEALQMLHNKRDANPPKKHGNIPL